MFVPGVCTPPIWGTHTQTATHPRTYTKRRRGRKNITAYGVYVSATVVSIRVNADATAWKEDWHGTNITQCETCMFCALVILQSMERKGILFRFADLNVMSTTAFHLRQMSLEKA